MSGSKRRPRGSRRHGSGTSQSSLGEGPPRQGQAAQAPSRARSSSGNSAQGGGRLRSTSLSSTATRGSDGGDGNGGGGGSLHANPRAATSKRPAPPARPGQREGAPGASHRRLSGERSTGRPESERSAGSVPLLDEGVSAMSVGSGSATAGQAAPVSASPQGGMGGPWAGGAHPLQRAASDSVWHSRAYGRGAAARAGRGGGVASGGSGGLHASGPLEAHMAGSASLYGQPQRQAMGTAFGGYSGPAPQGQPAGAGPWASWAAEGAPRGPVAPAWASAAQAPPPGGVPRPRTEPGSPSQGAAAPTPGLGGGGDSRAAPATAGAGMHRGGPPGSGAGAVQTPPSSSPPADGAFHLPTDLLNLRQSPPGSAPGQSAAPPFPMAGSGPMTSVGLQPMASGAPAFAGLGPGSRLEPVPGAPLQPSFAPSAVPSQQQAAHPVQPQMLSMPQAPQQQHTQQQGHGPAGVFGTGGMQAALPGQPLPNAPTTAHMGLAYAPPPQQGHPAPGFPGPRLPPGSGDMQLPPWQGGHGMYGALNADAKLFVPQQAGSGPGAPPPGQELPGQPVAWASGYATAASAGQPPAYVPAWQGAEQYSEGNNGLQPPSGSGQRPLW